MGGGEIFRRRLLDMGLTPKTKITVVKFAPGGDPVQIGVRGYVLSLRLSDAGRISVRL